MIIAFPLYLLLTRAVLREAAADPEKLDSDVRKFITYMALVVAASIFTGDLICALAFLLRGELTSRFLAKAFVVFALSGGVFWYYFLGLRNTEALKTSRDRSGALISSAVVALMLVLGFLQLGPPRTQRSLRADSQRVQQLYQLGNNIENYWRSHASQLPTSIDTLPGQHLDPITHAYYEYRPIKNSQFELCANFAQPSQTVENGPTIWTHPAGRHCFLLDATAQLPSPTEYSPY